MSRFIIIRGNSGSGKSVTARELQERLGYGTALIEQDYIRRKLLRERDRKGQPNIELIALNVRFAMRHCHTVILEGILVEKHYGRMIKGLLDEFPNHISYYFDVSLEETFRRHATKPNAHEFGEEDMKKWYISRDLLGVEGEQVIGEKLTREEIIEKIVKDIADITI